jgi:transposase
MKHQHQGKLLSMVKFREIIRLHELGYNQTQIATSCSVARSTVQDYIRRAQAKQLSYQQLQGLSDSEFHALLGKNQSSFSPACEINFELIHHELGHKGITLSLLWQEGLDRGDWTLSYGRYNQWKGAHNLSMRQVHKGGDKLFVDYCGLTIPVTDPISGTVSAAQIFVACLGASNYTFAEATPTQELAHWLGSHQRALAFFGGRPLPPTPFVLSEWKQAKVNIDYHSEFKRHYYSVPYWFVSRSVMVKITEHLIEIFYENQRIATHPRSRVPYRHTNLPEHMPPEHWTYKRQSRETFLAWAERVGPQTKHLTPALEPKQMCKMKTQAHSDHAPID